MNRMNGIRFTRNTQNTRFLGIFLAGNPTRPLAPVAWLPVGKIRMEIAIQNVGLVDGRCECSWSQFCYFVDARRTHRRTRSPIVFYYKKICRCVVQKNDAGINWPVQKPRVSV